MSTSYLNKEGNMSIAEKNLVEELSTGEVTLPKLGKLIAAIYIQTDSQGHKLDRLEKNLEDQKVVTEATLAQATKTNGRMNAAEPKIEALEEKVKSTFGCPGKCNDIEPKAIKALQLLEEHEQRMLKLEEPVKVRGIIWQGIVTTFTGVSAVLAVVFGFLYIPGVSEFIFKDKEERLIKMVVEQVQQQEKTHDNNSSKP
jgi:hypothetical protein